MVFEVKGLIHPKMKKLEGPLGLFIRKNAQKLLPIGVIQLVTEAVTLKQGCPNLLLAGPLSCRVWLQVASTHLPGSF